MMNTKQLQSLRNVIEYLWDDERKHFRDEELGSKNCQVFNDLYILKEYLDDQTKNEEGVEEPGEDWHSQANGEYPPVGVDGRFIKGGEGESEGGAQKD